MNLVYFLLQTPVWNLPVQKCQNRSSASQQFYPWLKHHWRDNLIIRLLRIIKYALLCKIQRFLLNKMTIFQILLKKAHDKEIFKEKALVKLAKKLAASEPLATAVFFILFISFKYSFFDRIISITYYHNLGIKICRAMSRFVNFG